jgi:5,10-methenyltetrahydrofolate synthetase
LADRDDDFPGAQFASPPCFMHELQPEFRPEAVDAQARRDVMRWRKAERERLIAARLAVPVEVRAQMAASIADGLDKAIGDFASHLISVYWPFRGEPDLRPWMDAVIDRGGRVALPVVVGKGRPLIFREWRRGDKLERGIWNIPVPAAGREVVPTVTIAPLVGYDAAHYRLGYGGGFFDRTLAALARKPLVIGVGYGMAAVPTIYPLPHDIRMDVIVTEEV